MKKKNVVLVVAAHPDDEVLGCGGSIASHVEEGDEVHLIIMADGVTSREYDPDRPLSRAEEMKKHRGIIDRRWQEALKAAQLLGLQKENVYGFCLADQRLDEYPLLELIKRIEKIKSAVRPQIVYTHFWNDFNLDHRLTCQAVCTAFRPDASGARENILCFEVPESTYLSVPLGEKAFIPDYWVDITKTLPRKLKALEAYESERRLSPHPRSVEFIKDLAARRGKAKGHPQAEAFMRLS